MDDLIGVELVNFEDFGKENGIRYWFASDLMVYLGYDDLKVFKKAINRAMAACAAVNIPITDNFTEHQRVVDGVEFPDFKLTRFACYLCAINADSRKPRVAQAQAYFAGLAEAVQKYVQSVEEIDRVITRDKLSEQEKSLSGVAHQAGVENYPFFQNAGYRGMYNMNLSELRNLKGVKSGRSVLDFMGKRELAANLFRLSETEATIKTEGVHGQKPLESTAERVGRRVRKIMQDNSGDVPERLPPAEDIAQVVKELKSTQKAMRQIDLGVEKKKGK